MSVEKRIPHGSLISPLLMDLTLHGIEKTLTNFTKTLTIKVKDGKSIVRRRRASSISIIRYADDSVVLHENKFVTKSCKGFIKSYLADLGLKLKNSKT